MLVGRQQITSPTARLWLKIAVSILCTTYVSVLAATAVLAVSSDPYPNGQSGYDVSYPQCGGTAPTGSFGIIGVKWGTAVQQQRLHWCGICGGADLDRSLPVHQYGLLGGCRPQYQTRR